MRFTSAISPVLCHVFIISYMNYLSRVHVCVLSFYLKNTKKFFNSGLRYGAPGVEFTGLHKDTATVTQIHFLYGQVTFIDHLFSKVLKRMQN